jgi:lysine 2,3-aminomutase
MSRTITTLAGLAKAGLLTPSPALEPVAARYAIALSPTMRGLIEAPDDPIARQFLPREEELASQPRENPDPIGDHAHSPLPGLVHRYPDRVLIKLTHACPVYCRFCFRREMVGPKGHGNLSDEQLEAIFAYLAAHPGIAEVIFTGGDPLMLSARRIAALGQRLAALPSVRLVRWHSRVPVVAPERITEALVRALKFPGKANYVAVHANHAREFSPEARKAIARLADGGIALLGQSVLLRNVNDSVAALLALFREMSANRITPAYLHHPDLAPGTAHFRPTIEEGQALHAALRGQLSGHAIPAYVLDLPGGHGKVEIGAGRLEKTPQGYRLRDPKGHWHDYAE